MHLRIESALRYAIFIMGFTALATQIVLLREALNIFQGNELVIGILLSNWMLLTGAGAYLGRFSGKHQYNLQFISITQLIIAILPVITIAGMYLVSTGLVKPGVMFSPGQTWLLTFTMLVPFCLLSGALFTLFCTTLTQFTNQRSIGQVYGIEALGSISGGLIFSLLLTHVLPAFHSLFILFWLNISAVLVLSLSKKFRILSILSILMGIIVIPLLLIVDIDDSITQLQYPGQDIILHQETPYGKIVLAESAGQVNFYENGALYFSSNQVEKNEEIIHYAMAQHDQPEKVLLVSGGISGTTLEIQKYTDIQIDYIEINPAWIEIGELYTEALSFPNVRPVSMDARRHIRNTKNEYDVVIIDLPAPATAQINRYYTLEFFLEVRQALKSNGIFSIHLPSSANYLSPALIQSHSTLNNTLQSVFEHTIIFPGTNDYFIASDKTLSFDILDHLLKSGIENTYVNAYYYIPELTAMRSEKIQEVLEPSVGVNHDLAPKSYFIQLSYWLSHFRSNLWGIGIFLILLSITVIIFANGINKALFVSGFSGASIEFILIICFQAIYGYVYQMTGLLITLFMGGLALGALILPKLISPSRKKYYFFQLGIGVLAIFIPLSIQYLSKPGGSETAIIIIINLLSLVTGIMIGFQFKQAAHLQEGNVGRAASSTYGVDLMGSTVGSLVTALMLVPLLGIVETCMIIAGLNFLISFSVMGKRIKA